MEENESKQEKDKPLTIGIGEKLVGTLNPTGNLRVARVKQICAELADIVGDDQPRSNDWPLHKILSYHAIGEILNEQMSVVKLITLEN